MCKCAVVNVRDVMKPEDWRDCCGVQQRNEEVTRQARAALLCNRGAFAFSDNTGVFQKSKNVLLGGFFISFFKSSFSMHYNLKINPRSSVLNCKHRSIDLMNFSQFQSYTGNLLPFSPLTFLLVKIMPSSSWVGDLPCALWDYFVTWLYGSTTWISQKLFGNSSE